jgi:excisionase family DNA binding protein
VTASLPAGDLRILDWLTASEAALELRLSVDTVRALAAAGVLERVEFGSQVRVTPESVAAHKHRQAAGSEPAGGGA